MGRLLHRLLVGQYKEVSMQKITVKLETVTPLFLGGIETRDGVLLNTEGGE